jgi:hypothetical protein
MENFGIPCMKGCARANQRVALGPGDENWEKAEKILWGLGLSNSMQEFYDEFGIIYGKLLFKYLIELIRENSVTDAAKLYRSILSESIKDRDSYFYNYYWDTILGLRILNKEFDSRFELSKIELEKKLNKKIENQLIKLKIPLANFENTIKVKILINTGNEHIEVDNKMNSQFKWSKNIGIVKDGKGNKIQLAQKETIWHLTNDSIPAYCYYDFDEKNGEKYGKLYNYWALKLISANPPEDWRIMRQKDISDFFNLDSLLNEINKGRNRYTEQIFDLEDFLSYFRFKEKEIPFIKSGQYHGNGFLGIDSQVYIWTDELIDNKYQKVINFFTELSGDGEIRFSPMNCKQCFFSIRLVKDK